MATLSVSTGAFRADTWYPYSQIKAYTWDSDDPASATGTKGGYSIALEGDGLLVDDTHKLVNGTIDSWAYNKGNTLLFTLTDLNNFNPLDDALTSSAAFRAALFAGADQLTGGASASNVIYGYGGDDEITGGDLGDTLKGGDGADDLHGGDGRDKLYGDAGADQLDGGNGADTMYGGDGDDTYVVDNTSDKIVEYKNEGDSDSVQASVTYTLSSYVENLTLTGADDINGTGNSLANTLVGNDGDNLLTGGSGNDTIDGGVGDDTLRGGNGDDDLTGGDGTDTVSYADAKKGVIVDLDAGTATDDAGGTDTLTTIENIVGGKYSDTLTGDAEDNSIDGGSGNDTLAGGAGDDTLVGGSGTDTADYSSAAAGVKVSLLMGEASDDGDGGVDTLSGIENVIGSDADADTIVGDSGANRLDGGEGDFDDSLYGSSGNDTLIGGGGDDVLDGGSGNDSMVGGDGDDTYIVGSSSDKVVEAADEGTDTVQSYVSYTLGANVERLELLGVADIKGTGNSGDNTFLGNSGDNTFDGKAGIDTIDYSAEHESVVVNLATGKAIGNSIGTDTLKNIENITGGHGDDSLTGNAGDNTIDGGDGDDSLAGGAGADVFSFQQGKFDQDDSVDGGDGDDTIQMTDSDSTDDNDFTNVTHVETIAAATDADLTMTLGSFADAAGFTTIDGNGTGVDTITVGAGFDNDLTINIAAGDDSIDGSASTADLTVAAEAAEITADDTLVGGSDDGDVLSLTADDDATGAVLGTDVSGFETITVVADADASIKITTDDANVAADATLTVGASALTEAGATLTFDGSDEADGNFDVTGGAGGDTITGGAGEDTIDGAGGADSLGGGDGDDVFTFLSANFDDNVSVDGGNGSDTIQMSDAAVIVDQDFTNVTNVETIAAATDADLTMTLGALADAADFDTITGNGTGVDAITVGAGFDNDLTINIAAGDDSIDGSASTADLTVATDAASITAADTLVGGSDGGDVLSLTADDDATGAVFGAHITGFETITVVEGDTASDDIKITMAEENVANGDTLTVDASALTDSDATFAFDGSAETDGGDFSITGGAGDDSILGGAGADSIDGGDGANTIDGGDGNDVLFGGAAVDSITGGEGEDQVTGGAGADHIDLTETTSAEDIVLLDDFSAADEITGFNVTAGDVTEDFLDISFAEVEGGGAFVRLDTAQALVDFHDAPVFATVTGATDLATVTAASNILIADLAGNIVDADALEVALQTGGDLQLTANGNWNDGDSFLAAFDDGIDTYIARVEVNGGVADDATFGDVTATVIAKLVGVDDVTDLAASNFDFIA